AHRSSLTDKGHSPLFAGSAAKISSSGDQETGSSSLRSAQHSASCRVSSTPTSAKTHTHLVDDTALINEGLHTSDEEDTIIPTSSVNVEVSDTSRDTSKKSVKRSAHSSSRHFTIVSPAGSPYSRRNSAASRNRSVSTRRLSTGKSS